MVLMTRAMEAEYIVGVHIFWEDIIVCATIILVGNDVEEGITYFCLKYNAELSTTAKP